MNRVLQEAEIPLWSCIRREPRSVQKQFVINPLPQPVLICYRIVANMLGIEKPTVGEVVVEFIIAVVTCRWGRLPVSLK